MRVEVQKAITLGVVLLLAMFATYLLADKSRDARLNEAKAAPTGNISKAEGLISADYTAGLKFGGEIVGFAVILAGFVGIAAGGNRVLVGSACTLTDVAPAVSGLGGVLAGASLLGIGGWAAPAAFAGLAIGASAVGVAKMVK